MSAATTFIRQRFADSYTDQLLDVKECPEAAHALGLVKEWYIAEWYVAEARRRELIGDTPK